MSPVAGCFSEMTTYSAAKSVEPSDSTLYIAHLSTVKEARLPLLVELARIGQAIYLLSQFIGMIAALHPPVDKIPVGVVEDFQMVVGWFVQE